MQIPSHLRFGNNKFALAAFTNHCQGWPVNDTALGKGWDLYVTEITNVGEWGRRQSVVCTDYRVNGADSGIYIV